MIKVFLFPTNGSFARPRTDRRPTVIERRRNRGQAVESYPFLEDLWYMDIKLESPLANSLISRLDRQEKKHLSRLIDEGRPIADALCRFLWLDPWMVDHLRFNWAVYLKFDRSWHPDRQWDIGAALALWTPETAPRSHDELERLNDLTYRFDGRPTPLYRSIHTPILPADRRRLRQLVLNDSDAHRMRTYLYFLDSLNQWIARQSGQNYHDDLPRLLGVSSVSGWWTLARRWHAINATLRRRYSRTSPSDEQAPIELHWPGLLSRDEKIGAFTFKSLMSHSQLKEHSESMRNCTASYVVRCALGESHIISIARDDEPVATLEVRKKMYGENTKILLIHAEAPERASPSAEVAHAVEHFLDACNDGSIPINPAALLPRSMRADLLAPIVQAQCIDYPTWVSAHLGLHYFDLHAHVTGLDLIGHYRAALELHVDTKDSLYQLALHAVQQCRALPSEVRDHLDTVVNAY